MTRRLTLAAPILLLALAASTNGTLAAGKRAVGPGVTITSPHNGAVIHGSTVTMRVAVSHFRLVAPTLDNPPILKGNSGHLHFVLDSPANFVPTRDVGVGPTHSWANVTPGPHRLIAYLATSQHMAFPGTHQAVVSIMVQSNAPRLKAGPITGGGVGMDSATDLKLPFLGLFVLLAGLGLRLGGRRLRRN